MTKEGRQISPGLRVAQCLKLLSFTAQTGEQLTKNNRSENNI